MQLLSQPKKIKPWAYTASICAMLAVSGCGEPGYKSVKKQWSESIKLYGLVPIYPMRENVYVGDLRVTGTLKDDFALGYRHFGHIDVSEAIRNEMALRPEFPKTKPKEIKNGNEVIEYTFAETTEGNGKTNIAAPRGKADRLYKAALPSVQIASLKAADLGAQYPVAPTSLLADLKFRASDTVNIILDGVETYELGDNAAWEAFHKTCLGEAYKEGALSASLGRVTQKSGQLGASPDGWLHMITRVFYARSITYSRTYEVETSVGAGAGQGQLQNVAAPQPDGGTPTKPATLAKQDNLKKLSIDLPGIAGSFARSDNGKLELIQVFERPMAFGADVLSIDLKRHTPNSVKCTGPSQEPGETANLTRGAPEGGEDLGE